MSTIDTTRADQARKDQETSNLVFWGWVCTILVSPIGFIIGIILTVKGRIGHGIWMMIVAILIMIALSTAMAAREQEQTYQFELSTPTEQSVQPTDSNGFAPGEDGYTGR